MEGLLGKFSPQIYAAMRIVASLLFFQHGAQKLFGLMGGNQVENFASLRGVAGVIEFFGGILMAVGFKTSLIAFLASGQMAVAYFLSHASRALFPIENRGELAVLYCFVFLYIAARGSGIWSVDAMMKKE